MDRRQLLRYGVASVVGVTAGGTIVAETTDTAAAAVSMGTLSVSDAATTTDDGSVADVLLSLSGEWQYDLPAGTSPATWTAEAVVTNGDSQATVDTTSGEAQYLRNSGSYELSGSLLQTDVYDAETFAAPDGKTREVTMGVAVVFRVTSDSDRVLAASTIQDTATVSVTNRAYNATQYGSVGGDGAVNVTLASDESG